MGERYLQIGSEGPEVADLQARLQFAGYYAGHVNGRFDAATASALVDYQEAAGVVASGGIHAAALHQLRTWTDSLGYDPTIGAGGGYAGNAAGGRHRRQRSIGDDAPFPWAPADGSDHRPAGRHSRADEAEPAENDRRPPVPATDETHRAAEPIAHGLRTGYWYSLREALAELRPRALHSAQLNDRAFLRVVDNFQRFASRSFAEFKDARIADAQVSRQFVQSWLDVVAMRFTAPDADGARPQFAIAISSALTTRTAAMAEAEVRHAVTGEQLKRGLDQLARRLRQQEVSAEAEVRAALEQHLAPLELAAEAEQMIPALRDDWVRRVNGARGAELDGVVEKVLGLPRPAKLPDLETRMYEHLVASFPLRRPARQPMSNGAVDPANGVNAPSGSSASP